MRLSVSTGTASSAACGSQPFAFCGAIPSTQADSIQFLELNAQQA